MYDRYIKDSFWSTFKKTVLTSARPSQGYSRLYESGIVEMKLKDIEKKKIQESVKQVEILDLIFSMTSQKDVSENKYINYDFVLSNVVHPENKAAFYTRIINRKLNLNLSIEK